MDIKSALEDQMYGRKQSPFLGALLSVLSAIYGLVISLRKGLYRLHIFRQRALPCKVVSIGNITLGGTGKTPTVVSIGGLLVAHHKQPVIVSRGYGRRDESRIAVVSDGRSVLVDAGTGGDEPVLIGDRLPGVPVVVGADRYAASRFAIERFKPGVVVLDDGFQHRKLRRDLDIVLVDATDPFGKGKLFPAGILREPLSALRRAHAVVITKADQSPTLDALKERIRRITPARMFTSFPRPVDLIDVRSKETKLLSALRGAKILSFSGIARPAAFIRMLKSLGAVISAEFTYPDHYEYTRSDLARIFQKAADARVSLIVTTEKDAVRLRTLHPEGMWALRIDLTIVEREEWESFILGSI